MNKNTRDMWKLKRMKKNVCDFVDNFPTNFLKRITFLHPMGVCGWTFHRTGLNKPRDRARIARDRAGITKDKWHIW